MPAKLYDLTEVYGRNFIGRAAPERRARLTAVGAGAGEGRAILACAVVAEESEIDAGHVRRRVE